jgi:hypothetical protein
MTAVNVRGRRAMVIKYPAISSMTIFGQSLWSNGLETGLRILEGAARRVEEELDVEWMSCMDIARVTFQGIGKKSGLSKETAIYRIKNLEKRGIIQRYTTLVNFSALGYTGYAVYSRYQNVNEEKRKRS